MTPVSTLLSSTQYKTSRRHNQINPSEIIIISWNSTHITSSVHAYSIVSTSTSTTFTLRLNFFSSLSFFSHFFFIRLFRFVLMVEYDAHTCFQLYNHWWWFLYELLKCFISLAFSGNKWRWLTDNKNHEYEKNRN